MPPMVIWGRKTLSPELACGEVPGTIYGLSTKGWIDTELFSVWFKKQFLRYAPASRPLLLLMDGHSSHYCLDTIKEAAKEDVILFVLPPNTTHLTQPLDKGVFGPLKKRWREVCHDYLVKHPGRVVTKYEFSQLFSKSWMNAMTIKNIQAGFSTTGIFPLHRDAIKFPVNDKSSDKSSGKEETLPCVTLYTPLKREAPKFKPEEVQLFGKCHSEGYDMSSDWRYLLWLKNCNTDSLDESDTNTYLPAKHATSLQDFLKCPSPPKRSTITEEQSARVLTNDEYIEQLEEKQREKASNEAKKKQRAEERRQKKDLKQQKKKRGKGTMARGE